MIYQRVGARAWVHLDIAYGAEADDHLSRTLREGWFPTSPATDLLFQMVRPGDRVLDLGANIGQFCLPLAAMGCQVVAVEASPRNAQLLEASIARNQFHNLRLIHAAVSDREGTLEFCPAGPYGHVASSISNKPSVKVRAATVDQLLAEIGWDRVDYIKMDIEGSEIAALRGMAGLLSRKHAPLMVYEANGYTLSFYNHTVNELKAVTEEFGYPNYLIQQGRLTPVRPQDMQLPVVADYLAARALPPGLHGWVLHTGQPSRDELLSAVVQGSCSANPVERAHTARTLQHAPAWLLSETRVLDVLSALRNDPVRLVHQNAAWSGNRPVHLTFKQHLVYKVRRPLIHQVRKVRDRVYQLVRRSA
jgi:FkbM family methyltransferase